jgi:hypothetical protein
MQSGITSIRGGGKNTKVLTRTPERQPVQTRRSQSEIVRRAVARARASGGVDMTEQALIATVSGSFRRAMGAVADAVYRLTDAGVRVLSPADPRVVDQFGDFLFVASDRARAIKLVESRHLAAIEASDFVWLVAPEGYIGQSGAMEVGFAVAVGTPVFCSEVPVDLTLRQYVTTLPQPEDALRAVHQGRNAHQRAASSPSILLNPTGVLQAAHDDLERIALELQQGREPISRAAGAAADRLHAQVVRPLRPN